MIAKANKEDINQLLEIWESAVLATHHFLARDDFEFFRTKLPSFLAEAENLYKYSDNGKMCAFLAVDGDSIDMLFVHNDVRGKGIGKKLISFATQTLGTHKVEVNEQNEQGVGFYSHMGFKEYARDEVDGYGKPYPILHLTI